MSNNPLREILKEDGSIDFKKFELLTESEQISYTKSWTPLQWKDYRMQNTISDEECFAPVLKLIDELERQEPMAISENEEHKYNSIPEEDWQNSRDINEYIADVKNGKIKPG